MCLCWKLGWYMMVYPQKSRIGLAPAFKVHCPRMEEVSRRSRWVKGEAGGYSFFCLCARLLAWIKVLGLPPVMPSVFIVWVKQISGVSEFNSLSVCVVSHLLLLYYVVSLLSFFSFISLPLACAISSPSILLSLITGTYSQSAAIQLRGNLDGKDHHAEGLHLSWPGNPTPTNPDASRTPPSTARKQLVDRELQQGQSSSDPVPGPSKRAMEGLEGAGIERVGTGISKVAGQGSGGGGGGVSSYYRPARRGSPRPSTHNDFDINEHLPWMIVLLLLLVLVVIVVCSVKRSSRVLKKGPMQDPSSIMEKAIQKKPSAPPTQAKEKWIYYSNGQGKPTFSLLSTWVVIVKNCGKVLRPLGWVMSKLAYEEVHGETSW